MRILPSRWLVCLALSAACVDDVDDNSSGHGEPDETSELDDAGADGFVAVRSGTLTESVRDVTVTIDRTLTPTLREQGWVWVLRGASTARLASVFSFVADDAYAQANVLDDGLAFEIVFDGDSELNSILSGMRMYLNFELAAPSGKQPARLSSTVTFAPALRAVSGSSSLRISGGMKPVLVGRDLVYRAVAASRYAGTASLANADLSGDGEDDVTVTQRAVSSASYNLDWTFAGVAAAAVEDHAALTVQWQRASGAPLTRTVRPKAMLASFTMAVTDDPYTRWPSDFACAPAVQACMDALGDELDTERCGSYQATRRCNLRAYPSELTGSPDDVTVFAAVVDTANASLPAPKQVSANFWMVNGRSQVADSLSQVMRGALVFDIARGAELPADLGQITEAALQTALAARGQRDLLAAAKQAVASNNLVIGSMRSQSRQYWIVWFPDASRVLVVSRAS